MNEKEEELMKVIVEASSTLDRAYYADLSESQLIIRMRRVAAELVRATEEI